MKEPSADVVLATDLKSVLRVPPTAEQLQQLFDQGDAGGDNLVERLRSSGRFDLVRDLLEPLARPAVAERLPTERAELVRQQLALAIYKDPDLPAKDRLDSAMRALAGGDPHTSELLARSENPETLGIAGAITRRYWQLDGHRSHLERALRYYDRGHHAAMAGQGPEHDRGFPGINAAFLRDQLARLWAEPDGVPGDEPEVSKLLREQAATIRREILAALEPLRARNSALLQNWWFVATTIEAQFGLGDFAAATATFREAGGTELPGWKIETTSKQLVALARLRGWFDPEAPRFTDDGARECLETFLAPRDPVTIALADQKVGLALSGGGFRASLYEIGTLAALAELDLLRHVEVISTVSGGSILGAHYYLELKHLLEHKGDSEITHADYIGVVERVIDTFLKGVQKNIRTRIVLNPIDTARMIFSSVYSRTMKAGELYEKHIYARASGAPAGDIKMRDLLIAPHGGPERFHPRKHNWTRRAKVPVLVLNATSLNTGHNWQFTARSMGEPPTETDIDVNPRLRRMNYEEDLDPLKKDDETSAAGAHADLRLGHAVAASACVPGLFEPLALAGLYEETAGGPTVVRLVDGGVHDNQGIGTLLEQDCSVLLVADGSGQMSYQRDPSQSPVGAALRTNGALMTRTREAQYRDVKTQREVGRRKGLTFVHLKDGLHTPPVNWVGCERRKDGTEDPGTADIGATTTSYGIRKSAQAKIAAIRTDLDSFSEVEAFALMYSCYRAALPALQQSLRGVLPMTEPAGHRWRFLTIAPFLEADTARTAEDRKVERQLAIGSKGAFRVWHLAPVLRLARWLVLGGLAAGAVLTAVYTWSHDITLLSLNDIWLFAMFLIATWLVGKTIMRMVRPRDLLTRIATGIGLAVVGTVVAGLHVLIFDPWFLRVGRVPQRGQRSGEGS